MNNIIIDYNTAKDVIEDLLDFYEVSITKFRVIEDINNLENKFAVNDILMFSSVITSLGFYIKESLNENEEIQKVQVYFNEELISEREYK
jgi:hypothetical protein